MFNSTRWQGRLWALGWPRANGLQPRASMKNCELEVPLPWCGDLNENQAAFVEASVVLVGDGDLFVTKRPSST